jgi:serine protease Do
MRRATAGVLLLGAVSTCLPGLVFPVGAQDRGALYRSVNPSVVVIRARGRDVEASGLTRFLETGSGVLVSADGKVMTAAHVVQAMDEINVEFLGGETVAARVVNSAPGADLSLLQLEHVPAGARVATMADSDTVQVGDSVIIVGAPYGLAHSMSAGWISARWPANSVYRAMPLAEFLQTDATINTGNSGGPMFNMAGAVIGIVSHNISKSGGSEGLGFVVTINTAKQLLLERPSFWSGLDGRLLEGPLAQILNLPQSSGYLVKTVAKGSPGEALGLRGGEVLATIMGEQIVVGGDIILKVQGIPVGEVADHRGVRDLMLRLPPGSEFTMTILRLGQVVELKGRHP